MAGQAVSSFVSLRTSLAMTLPRGIAFPDKFGDRLSPPVQRDSRPAEGGIRLWRTMTMKNIQKKRFILYTNISLKKIKIFLLPFCFFGVFILESLNDRFAPYQTYCLNNRMRGRTGKRQPEGSPFSFSIWELLIKFIYAKLST